MSVSTVEGFCSRSRSEYRKMLFMRGPQLSSQMLLSPESVWTAPAVRGLKETMKFGSAKSMMTVRLKSLRGSASRRS